MAILDVFQLSQNARHIEYCTSCCWLSHDKEKDWSTVKQVLHSYELFPPTISISLSRWKDVQQSCESAHSVTPVHYSVWFWNVQINELKKDCNQHLEYHSYTLCVYSLTKRDILFSLVSGFCVYSGMRYAQGERWEDGCDFNCVCEDAVTGRVSCTERSAWTWQ